MMHSSSKGAYLSSTLVTAYNVKAGLGKILAQKGI